MLTGLMRYGGSAAKVRTLYGQCLTAEDFRRMASMKSIPEVTAFLESHPAWHHELAGLDPAGTHRRQLEDILRRGMLNEHLRIYNFMSSSGAELYEEPILRIEQEEILSCYSSIRAGKAGAYTPKLPDALRKQSKIDFSALSACSSWASLLSAVSKTDFYPMLSRLRIPESGLPWYASVEWAMQTYVFTRLFNTAKKLAGGDAGRTMEAYAGTQVDLINISRVMRIKNYFPEAYHEYIDLLLPFSGKVSTAFLRDLYNAPDEAAAYRILLRSPYKKIFAKTKYRYTEEYYFHYLYDFSKRMLRTPVPSAFTVIAYLNLKEIEVQNIIKVTECVRYGKTPESAGVYLTGLL
ncbi:MAG: V-type ATPase subunit [Peptococcaceae bacterium]|jgi:V/A-type H+-transporting ATPase subunit C|nr:V-type ATPase subunit [Peptococcaceae bacterium]